MADNGVVILGATVSKSSRKVIAGPDVQMRGFIFLKDADNLDEFILNRFAPTDNFSAQQTYAAPKNPEFFLSFHIF